MVAGDYFTIVLTRLFGEPFVGPFHLLKADIKIYKNFKKKMLNVELY